jgi:hypothetical protein
MPETPADPAPKAKRALATLPIMVALMAFVAIAMFATSHFFVKGSAPQAEATPSQVATSQTPQRGPYNADDFSEPKSR